MVGRIRFVCCCEHWWSRASVLRPFFTYQWDFLCLFFLLPLFWLHLRYEYEQRMNGAQQWMGEWKIKHTMFCIIYSIFFLAWQPMNWRCHNLQFNEKDRDLCKHNLWNELRSQQQNEVLRSKMSVKKNEFHIIHCDFHLIYLNDVCKRRRWYVILKAFKNIKEYKKKFKIYWKINKYMHKVGKW